MAYSLYLAADYKHFEIPRMLYTTFCGKRRLPAMAIFRSFVKFKTSVKTRHSIRFRFGAGSGLTASICELPNSSRLGRSERLAASANITDLRLTQPGSLIAAVRLVAHSKEVNGRNWAGSGLSGLGNRFLQSRRISGNYWIADIEPPADLSL